MKIYQQPAPFAVQIEPVEGCSLACSFCALQTLRDNGADAATGKHGVNSAPYRFMTESTARRIGQEISRLRWNPRIELAMHGEPTMHPDLGDQIIGTLRAATRTTQQLYIMLTTNGSGLIKEGAIDRLFKKGLDTLAWDKYKHARWNEQVQARLYDYAVDKLIPLFDYPKDKKGSPHHRFKGPRIVRIHDISENHDGTHKLTNQGGNSGPAEPVQQRCAKPFRELSIRWDGNVALCCDDWKGEYKIGNVHDMPLDAIWHHERMHAARVALYHKRRDVIRVCKGCNVRTYRNGLLPDKMGKDKLEPLQMHHAAMIKRAEAGKIFSIKLMKGDK